MIRIRIILARRRRRAVHLGARQPHAPSSPGPQVVSRVAPVAVVHRQPASAQREARLPPGLELQGQPALLGAVPLRRGDEEEVPSDLDDERGGAREEREREGREEAAEEGEGDARAGVRGDQDHAGDEEGACEDAVDEEHGPVQRREVAVDALHAVREVLGEAEAERQAVR